mgnify:CR=1 FL=1
MVGKCFDSATEVLTERGFMPFSSVDCRIMQVTASGLEAVDAKPFVQDYDGEMVTLDSDDLNFSVTPNHDMVTTGGKIEAGAMYERARARAVDWIPRVAPGSECEADVSDTAIALAAAVACGREIVTRHDKVAFVYETNATGGLLDDDKSFDLAAIRSLSRRQARILVDTMLSFDGSTSSSGTRRLYTSRPDHAGAFEVAAVAAGYSVSVRRERFSDLSDMPNIVISVSERDAIPVRRWGREYKWRGGNRASRTGMEITRNADGKVWCVTVPSGRIVVRRNGFSMICGNCAEGLGLRRAFPAELSGTYAEGELPDDGPAPVDQGKAMADLAAALPASSKPALPAPAAADQLDDLLIAVRECEDEAALRRLAGDLGKLQGAQREQARKHSAFGSAKKADLPAESRAALASITETFLGYERETGDATPIVALLDADFVTVPELPGGSAGFVVLAATPFYVEAGGQVSDTGVLRGKSGVESRVVDVERRLDCRCGRHRADLPGGPRVPTQRVRRGDGPARVRHDGAGQQGNPGTGTRRPRTDLCPDARPGTRRDGARSHPGTGPG